MSASRRLKALFSQLETNNSVSQSDIIRMFVVVRELMESRKRFLEFPTLKFYCDWVVHSQLDRSQAKSMLATLSTILRNNWSNDPSIILMEVSNVLSVGKLHQEVHNLFRSEGLYTILLDDTRLWNQCLFWLIHDLLDKPVVGKIITQEEIAPDEIPTAKVLTLITAPEEGNRVYWQLQLDHRSYLRGLLRIL
jgi:hypothetical protein